jgi:hypothetical protein
MQPGPHVVMVGSGGTAAVGSSGTAAFGSSGTVVDAKGGWKGRKAPAGREGPGTGAAPEGRVAGGRSFLWCWEGNVAWECRAWSAGTCMSCSTTAKGAFEALEMLPRAASWIREWASYSSKLSKGHRARSQELMLASSQRHGHKACTESCCSHVG